MLKFNFQLLTLTALTLLGLSASVAADDTPRTAKLAAVKWLGAIDGGNYKQSWESAAPFFQSQINAKQWRKAAKAARKPLGRLVARELNRATYHSNLPSVPPGDYVVFVFDANYSKSKTTTESVTVTLVDGRWRASGYFVR